jgi:hypothetical protein
VKAEFLHVAFGAIADAIRVKKFYLHVPRSIGQLTKDEALSLRGMLAYVKSVEPGFLNRLRFKYGAENIRRIQTLA